MKNFVLLLLLFVIASAQAARITDNNLILGNGTTTGNKKLVFDTGIATNKEVKLDASTGDLSATSNKVIIGDGASSDKTIQFLDGAVNSTIKFESSTAEIESSANLRAPEIKIGSSTNGLKIDGGKLKFTNDGTIYKAIGSGSGGAGAPTLLENGGFEDGIASGWTSTGSTVTAVSGASALIGDGSASFDPASQNDYLRTSYFTVVKGLRGSACEARFLYSGGDALNYSAKVETESSVVLGTFNSGVGTNVLPIHASVGYESIYFKCPTEADITTLATNGNIRLVIYQGTATDATAMVVDDVHFGGLIGLVEVTTPDTFTAKIASDGTVTDENVNWISGNCVQATGARTCTLNSNLTTIAMNCGMTAVGGTRIPIVTSASTSTVVFETANTSGASTAADISVYCSKAGADAKQVVQVYKSIPKISSAINRLTAKVSSGDAVTDENVEWITGNCTNAGTGLATCTINADVFSVAPNCSCSPTSLNPDDPACTVSATSPTSLSINTSSDSISANGSFVLSCDKTGVDFKLPTVQPIIIGQVTNSAAESGLVNVRSESCKIANSGTASIDSSSGLCTGWVQSVARTALGVVAVTFIPSVFSSVPVCTVTADATATRGAAVTITPTTSTFSYTTSTDAGTMVDINAAINCAGKR